MVFKKYKVLNDCIGNLVAGINASTTSLTLGTGEGTSFPGITSGEFAIGTLVQYNTPADPTSGVAKKERVLISNKSGDIFTIARGQFGTTGTSFLAGDYFYINIVADIITDIEDEVERLETDKLNKNGQLRTGNGAWKITYNNGSGNETELSLGDSGKVLRSNGANQPPTFETPTVDVNGLTEDTTGNIVNDFFVKNNGTGNNTKIKVSRYMATDLEAKTGTNETKFINPKQAKDNYSFHILTASNNLKASSDTEVSSTTNTYAKLKEIVMGGVYGTVRVGFDIRDGDGVNSTFGRIYVNGIAIGTERVTSSITYVNFSEDITVKNGDLVQIYGRSSTGDSFFVRNFRLSYDRANFTEDFKFLI